MNEFHYFVSHGLGWMCAPTLEEAMEKAFCTRYFGDMGKWLKNCQKEGSAGIPAFTCRVPLAEDANYEIDYYLPQVKGLTERKNLIVTHCTLKKVAWMRDPQDKIRELEHKLMNGETA